MSRITSIHYTLPFLANRCFVCGKAEEHIHSPDDQQPMARLIVEYPLDFDGAAEHELEQKIRSEYEHYHHVRSFACTSVLCPLNPARKEEVEQTIKMNAGVPNEREAASSWYYLRALVHPFPQHAREVAIAIKFMRALGLEWHWLERRFNRERLLNVLQPHMLELERGDETTAPAAPPS